MAAGFYAKTLNASCINRVASCDTFSSLNSYLCFGSNEIAGPMGGLQSVGCPDTQYLMTNPTVPNIYGLSTRSYGYTPTELYVYPEWEVNGIYGQLLSLPSDYFFNIEELNAKVGTHTVDPYNRNIGNARYTRTYHGFRYANNICSIPLRKKYSQFKPYFKNFTEVDWTNWQQKGVGDQVDDYGYVGDDPLGNIYNDGGERSAPMLYTRGVEEPFLGQKFYEDTKSEINKSMVKNNIGFLPFCDPIKIYDAGGNHTGYTDGMAFQVFIFRATVKNRFLPLYYYYMDMKAGKLKIRYLDTHLQYFTIELWTYLSCYGIKQNIIKSPRIFTHRWFFWSQTESQNIDLGFKKPCEPYWYLRAYMPEERYIKFNLLPNNLNLQNKIFYIPWNKPSLFIGA